MQFLYYYHLLWMCSRSYEYCYTVFYLFQCFYFINFKTCFTYHTTLWALWVSQSNVYLPHSFVHTGTSLLLLAEGYAPPLTAFTGLKFIASVYLKNISLQCFCWTHIISFFVIQFSFFSLLKSMKLWMFWCSSCFVKVNEDSLWLVSCAPQTKYYTY